MEKLSFGEETINFHAGMVARFVNLEAECSMDLCGKIMTIRNGDKAYPLLRKLDDGTLWSNGVLCESCWEQLRLTILQEFDFMVFVEKAITRLCTDSDTKAMYAQYRNPYERLMKEIRRQMTSAVEEGVNQHNVSCGESFISAVA